MGYFRVWGPPEDHFQQLLAGGSDRFVFGTGQPLRIPEAAVASSSCSSLS